MVQPLLLDTQGGTSRRRDDRSTWFQRMLPRFLRPWRPSEARKSVERQLAARDAFPIQSWCRVGLEPKTVMPILELISEEMDWPNCHFLPEDSLRLVCIEGINELGFVEVFAAIKGRRGVHFTDEDVNRLHAIDNPTILDFVSWVLEQSRAQKGD